ncbi:GntR family transcriptional regulator [Pseudoruegeria sp. SK021]|uniref:GntR family transcriptional regulator n=1 Tax=Pseudoruegeria sp. SK021 TaxID=1933035 RepID=UPI000A25D09C|nr:GntR family transcriptional regulator [Pseudoruegeria sp. SK021]OSP54003.1 GntR family transcriptional regulator [Pseudoruegeria sp. SK021]
MPIQKDSKPAGALSDRAHRQITELIQKRELRGGETILEQRLAEKLGISRTPLREALQRLEGQGMISRSSGRSYLVRRVEMTEYLRSLKVRYLLEPEAAANAVGRLDRAAIQAARDEIADLRRLPRVQTDAHWQSDDTVHQLYGNSDGNDVMFGIIETLRVTTRLFEIAGLEARVEADFEEHDAILDALEANDASLARKAVRTHLRSLMTYSLKLLR